MASLNPICRSQSLFNKAPPSISLYPGFESSFVPKRVCFQFRVPARLDAIMPMKAASFVAVTTAPGEAKGFVQEMKAVALKLHTKEQVRGGEKEVENPEEEAIHKWEASTEGYLKFLVDSKLVYDTLEGIVDRAAYPFYVEFKNTGLERSESLTKDLEWLKEQGYSIPEPSPPGVTYSQYLNELADKDPPAFICHFYNIYFAHSAGGRLIGRKVAGMINGKELEFYKWDGDVKKMLQNVRDKLNKVSERWTREEKDHCLEETEKSFKYAREMLRLVLS